MTTRKRADSGTGDALRGFRIGVIPRSNGDRHASEFVAFFAGKVISCGGCIVHAYSSFLTPRLLAQARNLYRPENPYPLTIFILDSELDLLQQSERGEEHLREVVVYKGDGKLPLEEILLSRANILLSLSKDNLKPAIAAARRGIPCFLVGVGQQAGHKVERAVRRPLCNINRLTERVHRSIQDTEDPLDDLSSIFSHLRGHPELCAPPAVFGEASL